MVKTHNVKLVISNESGYSMTYVANWFKCGRIADGFSWPETISNCGTATILCYEVNGAVVPKCSGYVTYKMGGTDVTIAFSNPQLGWKNKVGVGTGGKFVWDAMYSNCFEPFEILIPLADKTILSFHLQCTGGETNMCDVKIVRSASSTSSAGAATLAS